MNPRLVTVTRVGGSHWRTMGTTAPAMGVAINPYSVRSNTTSLHKQQQQQLQSGGTPSQQDQRQYSQQHQMAGLSSSSLPVSLLSLSNNTNTTPTSTTITRRLFSQLARPKKGTPCPFKTLGVSKSATYKKIKVKFLKIAMSHHPDTNKAETKEEEERYRNAFIKARQAFESLMETEDGGAMIRPPEQDEKTSDEDFDNWFMKETGHHSPYSFLDPQTMKEVAEMEENIGHGLDRDGGMWTLAAMVSNAVKDGKDGTDLLRLEAGEVKEVNGHIDGVLRRTRRPRR